MDPATETSAAATGVQELLLTAAEKSGYHDPAVLREALERASFSQQSQVAAILATGHVAENEFLRELSLLLRMEWREETDVAPAENVRALFPARLALGFQILPETREDDAKNQLSLMIWDPFDNAAWQAVTHHHAGPIRLVMTTRRRLTEAVKEAYGVGAETFDELLEGRDEEIAAAKEEVNVLDGEDPEASVMKFVNQILREASSKGPPTSISSRSGTISGSATGSTASSTRFPSPPGSASFRIPSSPGSRLWHRLISRSGDFPRTAASP